MGLPAAQQHLGYVSVLRGQEQVGPSSSIYVRTATGHEEAVQALLAHGAAPERVHRIPNGIDQNLFRRTASRREAIRHALGFQAIVKRDDG